MYVLVMIIGIASITYQMLSYNKSRKNVRDIQKQLGAGKGQRFGIFFTENVIIILISAVLGTVIAELESEVPVCKSKSLLRIFLARVNSGYSIRRKKVGIYNSKLEVTNPKWNLQNQID